MVISFFIWIFNSSLELVIIIYYKYLSTAINTKFATVYLFRKTKKIVIYLDINNIFNYILI